MIHPQRTALLPRLRAQGFTMIEMMMVLVVIAVLALIALPSYQDRVLRTQVKEGQAMVEFVKQAVAVHYALKKTLPADNAAAGLPPEDRIVSTNVAKVTVTGGAVNIVYGNKANKAIAGKVLTLRPAIVPDFPQVPIAWVCGKAKVPDRMIAQGTDATSIPVMATPLDCMGPVKS
jgi:type IV pilus assembly protein PilA